MKQVIAVRDDLKLTKGKMAAQVGHACVEAVLNSSQKLLDAWLDEGAKKVVVRVANKQELFELQQHAKAEGLVASIITDAGHTHLPPGTPTCVAIGPDSDEKVDKVTGSLRMVG